MDEAQIANVRATLGLSAASVLVWRQNVPAVLAFLVSGTQWRTTLEPVEGGMKLLWIGLDYASAKVSIAEHELPIDPDTWAGLRVMENAARDALNGVDC